MDLYDPALPAIIEAGLRSHLGHTATFIAMIYLTAAPLGNLLNSI